MVVFFRLPCKKRGFMTADTEFEFRNEKEIGKPSG